MVHSADAFGCDTTEEHHVTAHIRVSKGSEFNVNSACCLTIYVKQAPL
uniref:Uncharacterized protein n=1 Tax=Anguilla anguilla TaxID=7936 RepID=A0A0E9WEU6_ANGAN